MGDSVELNRLRRRIAAMSGRPDHRSAGVVDGSSALLPVPEALSEILPQCGIARGDVVIATGARSLLSAMIASVSASGAAVGIVGLPALNLDMVAELGGDLSYVATVPTPGRDPVEVAGVLLDGMDLVVLGLSGTVVTPARARVVTGRVRTGRSTLLIVDGTWPGARLRLDAEVASYRHLPAGSMDLAAARTGYGRIGGMSLQVTATTRSGRRQTGEIDVMATGFGSHRTTMLMPSRHRFRLAVAN